MKTKARMRYISSIMIIAAMLLFIPSYGWTEVKDAKAYILRGFDYFMQGQYDRAIEDFNKAIAINPNFAEAYTNRGIAYGMKGQDDRAIEDFNKAIAINPNLAAAYANRGLAYANKGQDDRAISDLQKACDMGDENGCKGLKIVLQNR